MNPKKLMQAATEILVGILGDVNHFRDSRYATFHRNRTGLLKLRKHQAALDGWCRYEPSAWLDRSLSAGERKHYSETLKQMESEGLVLVERDQRGRAGWVGLTEAGCDLAERLAAVT